MKQIINSNGYRYKGHYPISCFYCWSSKVLLENQLEFCSNIFRGASPKRQISAQLALKVSRVLMLNNNSHLDPDDLAHSLTELPDETDY